MKNFFQKYGWLVLALFAFFFLLGSRSLNEPDEGRYGEIAREMVQTGDWIVPHLWYLPHLDKPPMTYWLVAISIKLFGPNEWAVRLPVALAGISGIFATFLLGCSIGGRKVGVWSALILQSSLLYFLMSRFLTTDIFLTQFITWAIYFFWRSWQTIAQNETPGSEFFKWHLAGWIAIAFAFLTKGPIALAIPLVTFAALAIFRRQKISSKKTLVAGLFAGFALFLILAAPWFLIVFQRVPDSAHYMILGQAAGHLLGTTIKNRTGSFFYFFGILAAGLLPWTILLGWLWRKNHWRNLDGTAKDAWLLLNVWAIFTFALFSLSHAKLPAYILPIFPALAVMLALRFFSGEKFPSETLAFGCLAVAFAAPITFPPLLKFIFGDELPLFLKWQMPIVIAVAAAVLLTAQKWKSKTIAAGAVIMTLIGFLIVAAEVPRFETTFKANQTFKPLAIALKDNFQPGDAIVCFGKFPEGLPFYAGDAISPTNRPYLCRVDVTQVPFEFPGNRERIGDFYLPDVPALVKLLQSDRRVWVISFSNYIESFEQFHPEAQLHPVKRVGRWELAVNR
ncbi:MAG TPA: glycosyltransferase family 39 protein [Verrucomicrobiae bacterium]|nr:glycosyltransferase family 39 protein [Verrucomicrobiae bacterium]